MKKSLFCLSMVGLVSISSAFAEENIFGGGAPNVPMINGKSNATNVDVGDLLYDTSDSNFYLRDSSSTWKNLSPSTSVVSSSANGLFPTSLSSLDDATATKLGRKNYAAGTTYNMVALNITGTNWTTTRGQLIPYQMQDGSWRLKFNITGTTSTSQGGGADYSITIAGVTFGPSSQAVTAQQLSGTSTSVIYSWANASSSDVSVRYSSAQPNHNFSGDVELASKPTWAY